MASKKERQRQTRLRRFWSNDLNNRVDITTVNTPRQVDDVGPKVGISDRRAPHFGKRLVVLTHSQKQIPELPSRRRIRRRQSQRLSQSTQRALLILILVPSDAEHEPQKIIARAQLHGALKLD